MRALAARGTAGRAWLAALAGFFALFVLALAGALPARAAEGDLVAIPALKAHVTDLAGALNESQRAALEAQLAGIEGAPGAKGMQIAVLLLPSTQPEPIEMYSIRVAEAWKIGHKGADNGVLIVVAVKDRKMRIEVGYGLEGAIPDAIAKRIIAEIMAPRFKAGDYAGGLSAAATEIQRRAGGTPEANPAADAQPRSPSASGESPLEHWFVFALMGAFIGGGILRAMFGRFMGALAAGGLGTLAAWFIIGTLGWALGVGFVVFLFVLLMGSGIFPGGFGGGGGGWGGGSSGWSGGGGGFGGGGASGDW